MITRKQVRAFPIKSWVVTLIAGLLLAGPPIQSWSSTGDNGARPVFKPLTPAVASKLPPWLKPSDVAGMSNEIPRTSVGASHRTDLATMDSRDKAQVLLKKVTRDIHNAERSSFYSPQADTEYRAGLRAFGKGNFAESITHLRSADRLVSGIPNERVMIG